MVRKTVNDGISLIAIEGDKSYTDIVLAGWSADDNLLLSW